MKNQKGITLVALVITIIVLLILAGVTIAALSGDNGILSNASKSNQQNAIGEAKDLVAMAINEATNAYYSATFLNETITGVTGGEGHQLATAVYYVKNKITVPSSVTISVTDAGLITIKTTDKNPQQTTAQISAKGGLGTWSPITNATT